MKFYNNKSKRLIYFQKTPIKKNHWDKIWLRNKVDLRKSILNYRKKSLVCKLTNQFIHPNEGPVLEGGCGLGFHVYSLAKMNYEVIGIDNAEATVKKLMRDVPEINVKLGDVRKISFSDDYFMGYWSIGVIEHFFHGFSEVAKEMFRTIKPKGYLFLVFPYMSPFRRFKARFHLYNFINDDFYYNDKISNNFYQYILNEEEVNSYFEKLGFILKYKDFQGGIKGFRDEIFVLKFFIRKFLYLLYRIQKPEFLRKLKRIIDLALCKFSAHMRILVFQKVS